MKIARLMLSAAAAALMLTGGVTAYAESEYKVIDNADLFPRKRKLPLKISFRTLRKNTVMMSLL